MFEAAMEPPIMTGRFWVFVAPLSLLACLIPSFAFGGEQRSASECTVEKAQTISIAEASRQRRRLEGACVKVTGILDGWTLYQDLGDIYRDTRIWRDHDPKMRMVARIGLRQFPEGVEPKPSKGGAIRLTVIGRMHDCGRDWGNHETNGEIIVSMGAGWCHYNSGGVLTPIAILAQDEIQVTRLAGKRAWRKFGDIAPLAKESPLAVETRQFLEQVFDAARQGDRRTLLDLHGYSLIGLDADGLQVSQEDDSVAVSDARRIIDLWFGNPYSHLSLVRLNAEPPAVQLFEPRWKSDGWPEVWACWGIAPMAEDNSSIDALNVYGRPYACMAMVKKRISSGSDNKVVEVWVAATYGGSSVMQEPLR